MSGVSEISRRRFVATGLAASAAGWSRLATHGRSAPAASIDPDDTLSTLLFFDDQRLNLRDRVTRHVGRPERIAESIYRHPNAHVVRLQVSATN
jgi:hypothetical protein